MPWLSVNCCAAGTISCGRLSQAMVSIVDVSSLSSSDYVAYRTSVFRAVFVFRLLVLISNADRRETQQSLSRAAPRACSEMRIDFIWKRAREAVYSVRDAPHGRLSMLLVFMVANI